MGSEMFPSIFGASQWAGDRKKGMDAAAYIAESIRDPLAFQSPTSSLRMPTLNVSDNELSALVAYLVDESA
jgi:hypothetical protein